MMRFLIWLAIFVGAVWLGHHIQLDPGYMLLVYKKTSVEMPLWFGLFAVLLGFYIFHLLLLGLSQFRIAYVGIHDWSKNRRRLKAKELSQQGLISLTEGNWQQAETLLLRGIKNNTSPLINYLSAARAAQGLGAYERRDQYLQQAHNAQPTADVAIGLTQAQLQLDHHQLEQGLATLRRLRELVPQHPYVLKLLKQLYLELRDWKSLLKLLPALKKRQVLNSAEMTALEINVHRALLELAIKHPSKSSPSDIWQEIPRGLKQEKPLVLLYADYLMRDGHDDQAEQLLMTSLRKQWDNDLVELYGRTKASDSAKQLHRAESWLKHHNNNPTLLFCLGRLAIQNQLWGKARDYLQYSSQLAPNALIFAELGQLQEQLGEENQALSCYRQGLSHATQTQLKQYNKETT